ncbi:hypothetical protein tb265_14610 [Gemmatimonadetes bacterium T265]|nr:hypothetical protein tb265_14610 [Gemmatimonadetes bacterium T265]
MLILDTNVYIDVLADSGLANRLADAVEASGEIIGLSSVVVAELLIGARAHERARLTAFVTDGVAPSDYCTPTHEDWMAAGAALQRLGGEEATRGRSFWNDLLIAASCARVSATLLTRNVEDFRPILRIIPVAVDARPA